MAGDLLKALRRYGPNYASAPNPSFTANTLSGALPGLICEKICLTIPIDGKPLNGRVIFCVHQSLNEEMKADPS